MIKSALLFVTFCSCSPFDQDCAEIVYHGLRFEAVGRIDWTPRPDHYWRFDWDLNDPLNRRNYEKALAKQAITFMPYGST